MDWDSKMPSWDMEEGLVQNVEPNQSGMGSQAGGGRMAVDCSVDLKLGGLGEFRAPDRWKDQPRASPSSTAMATSASPSKRARPPSGAAQNVSCLVDGCKADLSGCREYHRRHKVCEAHSKTPVVLVGGQEQRFCQQCSR